ncbi:MAG: helix-turn-helix domain-containing protein [Bacteroidota bacterium]
MDISNELLFFFSALGAFNGLLLGFYFWFYAKPKHISNFFLGALMLSLSIRIGKSVIFYFNPDLAGIYLQFGLSFCLFIGPALYFYFKSLHNELEAKAYWKYHFAFWLIVITLLAVFVPFDQYLDLWRPYIIHSIYVVWLLYLLAGGLEIRKVFVVLLSKNQSVGSHDIWVLSLFIGNVVIWLAFWIFQYTSYIIGALSFSFILYLLILILILNRNKASAHLGNQKYGDKRIEDNEALELEQQLRRLMQEDQCYKDANVTMPDVAKRMNLLPYRLSQLLNDNMQRSFPAFINEYRITMAKELILSRSQYSLEAIGYECGFNSKSTFFASFKKFTGTTPAKFKEQKSI